MALTPSKKNKMWKISALTSLSAVVAAVIAVFYIDSFSDSINWFNTKQDVAISFTSGLALGITIVIWYPIKILLRWNKKRKLVNKNLDLDIKLKENQLEQSQSLVQKKE
ncbi:hypothetical protein [[Mycoplasma] testudinis]|uniref:hypothetical protein n=1 Tax=[Mycoplasma] testudinis TaxID=33924 RepID=UPI0012EC5D57|nr:hypothetical protein [[Mycoplasma] testudinis]